MVGSDVVIVTAVVTSVRLHGGGVKVGEGLQAGKHLWDVSRNTR